MNIQLVKPGDWFWLGSYRAVVSRPYDTENNLLWFFKLEYEPYEFCVKCTGDEEVFVENKEEFQESWPQEPKLFDVFDADESNNTYCKACGACGTANGCCPPTQCHRFRCQYPEAYPKGYADDQKMMSLWFDCLQALGIENPHDLTEEKITEIKNNEKSNR